MQNLATVNELVDQLSEPENEFLMTHLCKDIIEFDTVKEVRQKKTEEKKKMIKRA